MRLRGAALAAVLTGSVLTGTATAVSPAAAAANPAITIKAIDQAGVRVPVTASLESLDGKVNVTLTSSSPTRVPKDTYNIAAWVREPHGSPVQTLVDREITITGAVTVTFDARQGRQIQFTVNDPTVVMNRMTVEPFDPRKRMYAFQTVNYNTAAEYTYMVPGKLPPGWEVLVEGEMIAPTEPSPVDYIFVRELKGSIPSSLTFASDKAELATDRVTVRQVTDDVRPPGRTAEPTLWPGLPGPPLPTTAYGQDGPAPYTLDFRVTPGYRYSQCASYGDGGCDSVGTINVPVWRAGDHFAQTFGRAVFGPSAQVDGAVTGTSLTTGAYQGDYLLVDPTQDPYSFGLPTVTHQAWLYEGSKLLAHSWSGTVSAKISRATHWYRLRIAASRGPGASLFKSLTLSYNFPAHANSGGADGFYSFWPRIVPTGLSARNSAPLGTKTTVPMRFANLDGVVAVHNVKVWASVNGGKTWTALRVRHSGNQWTVVVANPGKPGYVSLRVQGTDAAGSTANETVINAYRVS